MAAGSSNPLRQQMINMMYLVLTALLALNVSAEILKAFQTVNEGMDRSILLIDDKNSANDKRLNKLYNESPDGLKDIYEKANLATKICNELFKESEDLKQEIITKSGGVDPATGELKGMKDMETTTLIMVEQGKGDALQASIAKVSNQLKTVMAGVEGMTDPKVVETWANNNIVIKEDKPKNPNLTWATESFNMVPVIACVTLLTKIQQDIRNSQANVTSALLASIGMDKVSFDNFIPVINVTTGKSSVSVGEEFKAEILLAAYDSKQESEIWIGGKKYPVKNGKAEYTGSTGSQGSHNLPGKIVVKNIKKGTSEDYPFTLAYDVFQSAAIISATKMNVLYVGLDNPVDISVPGYKPSDVSASMSGTGSLKSLGSGGKYMATVRAPRGKRPTPVKINVSAGGRHIGSKDFRIKNVPKPYAVFGSKVSGDISRAEIRTVRNIIARLENFAFEGLQFKVTKFDMLYVTKKGGAVPFKGKGNALSNQMKTAIANAPRGAQIIVTNIYAKAPKVPERRLPSGIVLNVK